MLLLLLKTLGWMTVTKVITQLYAKVPSLPDGEAEAGYGDSITIVHGLVIQLNFTVGIKAGYF